MIIEGEQLREPPGWAIVMSKPSAEAVAERSIREAGYRVYLPRYREMARGKADRDGKRIWRRGEVIMLPLFRGYLFAELHPGQVGLLTSTQGRDTRLPNSDGSISMGRETGPPLAGVERLLRYQPSADVPGSPKLLSADIIEAIRAAVDAGEFDQARPTKKGKRMDIEIGNQVRVSDGPFASFIGRLTRLDDDGRAMALLDVFGRDTPIEIDQAALQLVSA